MLPLIQVNKPAICRLQLLLVCCGIIAVTTFAQRTRISLNDGWRFYRYATGEQPDSLIYDTRPAISDRRDDKVADSKPTEAVKVQALQTVLKPWILPTANAFIKDPARRYTRPAGQPGSDFPFVQTNYDDRHWRPVTLPHDWGIEGPFLAGPNAEVGGGMGRLASHGVAWYRRKLDIPASDTGKSFFLEIDGAMSYAMVWLNGQLVGGWPYGYNAFQLNLTPYIKVGGVNQLAIRIDNPPASARWYPGGGLYRNVWFITTNHVHVGQWGSFVTTKNVSASSAEIELNITVDNDGSTTTNFDVFSRLYQLNEKGELTGEPVATFPSFRMNIAPGRSPTISTEVKLNKPRLWGPPPHQQPNLYVIVSQVRVDGKPVDEYHTRFGIRNLDFDAEKGLLVNGERIRIQGVNQHHDLGALGAAFNTRAAERQLEILRELGCNAIRMSHNPPASELLALCDRMGFLVINEIFDSWERKKTPLDFHLIFPDWHEPDTRAFVRRDRNAPSVIMWSFGNEVGEQYTADTGAAVGKRLAEIVKEEDPTRPVTASMNYAKPNMPFPQIMDVLSLNYQGEGIRDAPAYAHLKGIRTSPLYPAFHEKFPDKLIVSSETSSALSTRGTYLFPVTEGNSAPAEDGKGGDPQTSWVSAYELYTAQFGASPDKVFASQDKHPYVAGEFVWSGWDYLGEPTPYYSARSSYSGIIDLAGFRKDRFYLYQSRWRPDWPMAHILPHWNWPNRIGQVTPVHVFTSGDEAELYLNGQSLGRKKKGAYEYRLRWDEVVYQPGELKVVAYKNGKNWAEDKVQTTGAATKLKATVDRQQVAADGNDLAFITVQVLDAAGRPVPDATNRISFTVEGPGTLVATDNGDPQDLEAFHSPSRKALSGMALAIVRSVKGKPGTMHITVSGAGLEKTAIEVITK